MYVPFTGLGLYNGYRGKRWLKNRIKIFKHFVVPSLENQTDKDFVIWVSWRYEDLLNNEVIDLEKYLKSKFNKVVFTYSGVCFWDDKYSDVEARDRLLKAINGANGKLANIIGDCDNVIMTIQPSDDVYSINLVEKVKSIFKETDYNAVSFTCGYVMDYLTLRLAEWNPKTNPPFFSILFKKDIFLNPLSHIEYTGPYKSHEYVGEKLKLLSIPDRQFIVGTHGENISTIFNHPFKGTEFPNFQEKLDNFGLYDCVPIVINSSIRKKIMRKLPYGWQRKIRYIFGEKFYNKFYEWIRS